MSCHCTVCEELLCKHAEYHRADTLTTFARLLTEALTKKSYEAAFGGVQNPLGITTDNLSAPIDEQRRFGDLRHFKYPAVDNSSPDAKHLKRPLLIARVTNFAMHEILLDGSHRLNYWERSGENPDSQKSIHLHEVTLTPEQISRLTSLK